MKKSIALLLLLCLVKFNFAQDTSITRKGFSIEPSESFGNATTSGYTHITTALGCGLNYMFSNNLGIATGFQFKTYSMEISFTQTPSNPFPISTVGFNGNDTNIVGGISSDVVYKFTYLEVPLIIRYVSSQSRKTGFFAEAGLVFGFLQNASVNGSVNTTQYQGSYNGSSDEYYYNGITTVTSTKITNPNPDVNSTNTSFHLSLGVFIPLSAKISFISSVETNFGLSSIGKDDKDVTPVYTYSSNISTGNQTEIFNYNYYDHTGIINYAAQTNQYPSTFSLMFKLALNIKL